MAPSDKSHRHSLPAPLTRTSPPTPPGAAPALPSIPSLSPIGDIDKARHRASLSVDRPWPFGGDNDDFVVAAPTSPANEQPPAAKKSGLNRSSTMKSPLSILRRRWPGWSSEAKDEDGRQLTSRPTSLEIRNVPRQPSPTFRLVDHAGAQATLHDDDRPPTPPEKDKKAGLAQVIKARRRSNISLQSPRQLGLLPSPTPSLSCESATAASILGDSTPDSSPRPSIELAPRPSIEIGPGSLGVQVLPIDDRTACLPQRSSSLDRTDPCACSICLRSKAADQTNTQPVRQHQPIHL